MLYIQYTKRMTFVEIWEVEKYAGENIADSFSDAIAYQRFQISADELEMAEDIANE